MFFRTTSRVHSRADILAALGEPSCWRVPLLSRILKHFEPEFVVYGIHKQLPTLTIRHPTGIVLHVHAGIMSWIVRMPGHSDGDENVAVIPNHKVSSSLADFQFDLDRVAGPMARQRLQRVLHRVQLGFAQSRLAPGRISVHLIQLLPDDQSGMHLRAAYGEAYSCVPDPVRRELIACHEILSPSSQGDAFVRAEDLSLDIPSTQHEILSLMEDMQAQDVQHAGA